METFKRIHENINQTKQNKEKKERKKETESLGQSGNDVAVQTTQYLLIDRCILSESKSNVSQTWCI